MTTNPEINAQTAEPRPSAPSCQTEGCNHTPKNGNPYCDACLETQYTRIAQAPYGV